MATNRKAWTTHTLDSIASGTIEEAKIRAMRVIIRNTLNMRGLTKDDADRMFDVAQFVRMRKPHVSIEQARKGADWLYKQAFKKDGQPRNTEFAQALRNHDLNVIRECYANPRFQLVDLEQCESSHGYITAIFPVYRCHGDNGKSFDYSARAWQSGGNSFVIEGSREYGRGF